MKHIGAHVSTEGGVFNAPLNAVAIGAHAFACFTKNQRRWSSPPYSAEIITKFKNNLTTTKLAPAYILPHGSYLLNLGNPEPAKRQLSINALIDELNRCAQLGLTMLNIHPGSHLNKISITECLTHIAASINVALAATPKVAIILENTAGQGGNVGYELAQLATIIAKVDDKSRIGVCIDTCHLFAAGYDFRTYSQYKEFWKNFKNTIGLNYLKGIHLNDSKGGLGSRIDRHHSLGLGEIGLEPFKFFMQDPNFDHIPLILETIDPSIWEQEIKLLYKFAQAK